MIKRKTDKTNFICEEKFETDKAAFNERELRLIFNRKYFAYIKRLEREFDF